MRALLILTLVSFISASAQAALLPNLQCVGTEPFWGITTEDTGILTLNDPMSEKEQIYTQVSLKNADGTTADFAFQIEAHNQAQSVLKLNVLKSTCSDGMSEEVYPYTALVDVEGRILFGCCK